MKNIYQSFCVCLLLCLSCIASAQVPNLNSYPAASAAIFLDFDGHTVNGTSWNSSGPIVCDGSNLNSAQMTEVFNRVAEDFRPFNLNVTTDSTKYWAAPANKRMRVILTTSSSWYGTAGGVAFTTSFTWGDNTPCFVFTALHKYNVKNISEAASHEAGHTLGLNHQSSYDPVCNKTAEYNPGTGSGTIGWAPIMGVGYYRNLTLWHYGANPFGCSNMQDDLSIITGSANGVGYRNDDFGSTALTAAAATIADNKFSVNGIIERPNDMDMVKFTLTGRSRIQLSALPYSVATGEIGANVDMQVELLNSTLTETSVYNPEATLSVAIDTVLPAGTYFLRVQGKGNTYAPNYASLGSYTLNGSIAATTLPVHKLALKATTEAGRHKLDWEIIADEAVVSQTLEVSTDGIQFRPVAEVGPNARNFAYLPVNAAMHYYRLHVTFDNGRQYYSNVTVLRGQAGNNKPFLVGNFVTGNLSINSPSPFVYTIVDLNGRSVAKGQLSQGLNTIATGFMTNGLYIIQYTNNKEQYTEKFMKQ